MDDSAKSSDSSAFDMWVIYTVMENAQHIWLHLFLRASYMKRRSEPEEANELWSDDSSEITPKEWSGVSENVR